MKHEDKRLQLTVGLVGPSFSGKSAIVSLYCLERPCEKYDATIEDTYQKNVDVNTNKFTLSIVDFGGNEEYLEDIIPSLEQCQVFAVAFSLADVKSVDEAEKWYERLCMLHEKRGIPRSLLPVVFVGTKSDQIRTVSADLANSTANKHEAPYVETSAKAHPGVGINELFTKLVERWMAVTGKDGDGVTRGYLTKVSSGWRRKKTIRWFKLDGNKLEFYSDMNAEKTGQAAIGTLNLDGAAITKQNKKKSTICLQGPCLNDSKKNKRTYTLQSKDEHYLMWLNAIQTELSKAKKR